MINKKHLTKHIWYNDEKYQLLKVYSPSKFEDWLILSRETCNVFKDGSHSHDVVAIQDGNDTWYPDTTRVRQLIEKKKELATNHALRTVNDALERIHLDVWRDKPEDVKW